MATPARPCVPVMMAKFSRMDRDRAISSPAKASAPCRRSDVSLRTLRSVSPEASL
jgi:hypothetical protein